MGCFRAEGLRGLVNNWERAMRVTLPGRTGEGGCSLGILRERSFDKAIVPWSLRADGCCLKDWLKPGRDMVSHTGERIEDDRLASYG